MAYYQVLAHELSRKVVEAPKRKRARKPAGTAEGGEFVGDDPATPENEAFESES